MATNPNPEKITNEIWWLWEQLDRLIPSSTLGGIYANKSGYHNTVKANQATWPGSYSVKLPLDTQHPPKDKARGIDLTLSDAEMTRRTGYLKRAAEHPEDNRLYGLREFIGTLDGARVFCMIRDTDSGPWRIDWSRDSSHLWHIHLSFWTFYCANLRVMQALVSVLTGETWDQWKAQDMAFRIKITSSDPDWNGKVIIGGGGVRFTARQPGQIHSALKMLYPIEYAFNDGTRGDLGWDSFLDGVLGEDIGTRTTSLDARFAEIIERIDELEVDAGLTPHTHDVAAAQTGAATPST